MSETNADPPARLWRIDANVDALNALGPGTLGEAIGMEFTEVGDDYLLARMPVDARTKQPYGLLHGGASAALAETMGSVASAISVDPEQFIAVGTELSCSHLRGARDGYVYGKCTPWRRGRTQHVWNIEISNKLGKLVCVSRLSVSILPHPS